MTAWSNDPERITFFATTHTRGTYRAFGIRAKDRDKHFYVIGKSGMGKSTMLENMAIQDIQNGEGMIFIDPHGSTAEKLLDFIPEDRITDTMYFAPFDTEFPIGFNILEDVGYDNRHKVVAGLMGVFERIWADAWSARMQYILQNTLFALLEYPGATIVDVNRMLVNKAFREEVVQHITDPVVESFWKEEFAGYSDRYTQDATPAIQNKIGQLVSNPLIRNILSQEKSTFDLRKMMDERKVIIINLSKGRMGEANAALLGSMLVIKIYLAALSRAEESAPKIRELPPCYFYVDEFQNVVNRAFENILSEARKYKLCLTIANQYIAQLSDGAANTEVRDAVFGNVGSTAIFRVGPMDAEFLGPLFEPTFTAEDMVGLGRGDVYLTLMIDGVGSAPFSAHTIPPIDEPPTSFREKVIAYTQRTYGRPREGIERITKEANTKWQDAAKQKHKDESSKGQSKGGKSGPPFKKPFPPRDARDGGAPRPPRDDRPRERDAERPIEREAPAYRAPREEKNPAEILRAMKSEQEQKAPPQDRGTREQHKKPESKERQALRDALQALRPQSSDTTAPVPVTPPTRAPQQPPRQPAPSQHPSTSKDPSHTAPPDRDATDAIRRFLHEDN